MRNALSLPSRVITLAMILALGSILAPPAFAGGGAPANPGTYMGDFNGDGRTDVLVSNTVSRELYVYVTATGIPTTVNVFASQSALLTTLPEGASVQAVGDFNGDDRADILVQSGLNLVVLVNDASVPAGNPVALDPALTGWIGTPPAGWSVSGVGDANNDGLADTYVHNTNGTVYVYITSLTEPDYADKPRGSASLSGAPIALPDTWTVATVADMNGDGLSDFTGQAPSAGGFSTLYTFISAVGGITVDGAASGSPAGVPDGYGCCAAGLTSDAATSSSFVVMDESGGATDGLLYVFVTDATGVAVDAGASTNSVTLPTNWGVEGLADFNNDGIVDTVAVEDGSGSMIVYLNSGPGTVSATPFMTNVPTDWEVANFTGMSATTPESGSASAGTCEYNNLFSASTDCKEYSGSAWTPTTAAASCLAGSQSADPGVWSAASQCSLPASLGRCDVVFDPPGNDYSLQLGGDQPTSCTPAATGCGFITPGSGTFTPEGVCLP